MKHPEKMWKYNKNDFEERKHWPAYREAYQGVFEHCSPAVEWDIVPSDKNWYKEYLVAKRVVDAFEKMNPKYPPMSLD